MDLTFVHRLPRLRLLFCASLLNMGLMYEDGPSFEQHVLYKLSDSVHGA